MKQQFQQFFNNDYTDFSSFLNKVLFPIFGENNFEKGYDVLTQDSEIEQKAAEANIIEIKHIGTFSTDLAADIKLFEVVLSDNSRIERSRINIQQLIRRYVETFEGAFMVFHYQNPENRSWRFSYVEKRSSLTDSTSAKRYTYLFGKDYACRTAAQRFNDLYKLQQNVTLQDITTAFSVEALSDEFFERYRNIYADFIEFISGKRFEKEKGKWVEKEKQAPDPQFQTAFAGNDKAVRDYVKKMLGRLVFLQFLQKKGWMGVPLDKPYGEGDSNYMQQLFANSKQQDNFLEEILETLFFDTLNKDDRPNEIADPRLGVNIKIPYLNGGLFEQDELDKKKVVFPANYFKQLFNFFGEYNFTIDENDPNDAELGVDPEMLGRIFENLLEDNKDKGAFYTPKEIVQYMCQESLIAYLTTGNETNEDSIKELVLHHKADSLSDTLKEVLDQKLKELKVCDPAIGSGAFPMGMMNEIFKCRIAIEGITDNAAKIKKHIIQNNIYGVDIENGAVDIARLRFWLALVVDETAPQPLPNLDYKIMQGNSLLESFEGHDLSRIIKTPPKSSNNSKTKITKNLFGEIENPQLSMGFDAEQTQANLNILIRDYFQIKNSEDKHLKAGMINTQIKEHIKTCAGHTPEINEKVDAIDFNNKNFFLWHLYFADVFEKGGFDIVIGNPPYGVSIKGEYRKQVENSLGKVPDYEIYYYFIELIKRKIKNNGILSYIIPNTYLFNTFAANYRLNILNNWEVLEILDCTKFEIFQSATVRNTINTWRKSTNTQVGYRTTKNINSFEDLIKNPKQVIKTNELITLNQNWGLAFMLDKNTIQLVSNIKKNTTGLINYFDVSQGYIPYRRSDLIESYGKQKGNEIVDNREWHSTAKESNEHIPEVFGRDLNKYGKISNETKSYVWYGKHLACYVDLRFFNQKRILVREITNPRIIAALISETYVNDPQLISIIPNIKGKFSLEFLWAILNSKLATFLHFNNSPKATKGAFPKILVQDIKEFPLPNISDFQQQFINTLADFIIFLHNIGNLPINEYVPNSHIIQLFEEVIEACIYELYFEEEIKAAQVDILELIGQSLQKVSSLPIEQQILNLFDAWSEYKNEVRNRIILQETRSESVAIIVNSMNL